MSFLEPNSTVFAIGMPGPAELILILVIVLVVFGHNRIPQLGDALGKGIRNFKKSFSKDETEVEPTHVEVKPVTESKPSTTEQVVTQDEHSDVT